MAHEHVAAGIAAALRVGAWTADAVALEARKVAQLDSEPGSPPPARSPALAWLDEPGVVSLTERRMSALPPDTRPLPSVAIYDQLLRRPAAGSPSPSGEEGRP